MSPSASPEAEVAEAGVAAAVKRPSLFGAAVMTYGTNVATAFLSLANVLIVARSLGPHGRGDVAFLITVATMTGQLAGLSIQEANGNLAGTHPHLKSRLATNSVLLSVMLGLIAGLVVGVVVHFFPTVGGQVPRALLWLMLGSVPFVMLRLYFTFLLQADYIFTVTNVAWVLGPTTTFLTNGTLGVLGVLSVETATIAWIVGQGLGVVLLAVYVGRHAGFGRPDLATAKRVLSFSGKVHLSRFMTVGNYRGDQWFLGSIAGSKALGIYSVAVAWAEALFYLPGVLVMIQRPDLVRANRSDAAAYAARIFRVAITLAALAAVGLLIAAPFLCIVLFGREFGGAVPELRVLACAAFGISAVELLSGAMIAQRKPLHASAAVLVAFAFTIVGNIVLIPIAGGMGAALARTLAYTAGGMAAALIFSRTLRAQVTDLLPRGMEVPWFLGKLKSRLTRARA